MRAVTRPHFESMEVSLGSLAKIALYGNQQLVEFILFIEKQFLTNPGQSVEYSVDVPVRSSLHKEDYFRNEFETNFNLTVYDCLCNLFID